MANLKHVKPGDRLVIPAATFNTFVDSARDYLQRRQSSGRQTYAQHRQGDIVLVRNSSGADRARYEVLGIDGVVIEPADSEEGFTERVALDGVVPQDPDHRGRFVVLGEPIIVPTKQDGAEPVPHFGPIAEPLCTSPSTRAADPWSLPPSPRR